MKALWILCLVLTATRINAGEYRFERWETTGICERVHCRNGVAAAVKFTEDSDPESLAILRALIDRGVDGTKEVEKFRGVWWEQKILLKGEFASGKKWTMSGKGMAGAEAYWDFRITGLQVIFPVTRHEISPGGDPTNGPAIIETHFEFRSLLPNGVVVNGKQVDLTKHSSSLPVYP